MNIAEKIQYYRKEKQISQEQLAEKMLVSRQAISKWEQGTAIPTIDNCQQLCRIFEITMDELTGFQEVTNHIDQKQPSMIKTKKRMFISTAILLVLLVISLSFNGVLFVGRNQLKQDIEDLKHHIASLEGQAVVVHPPVDSEIESWDIQGKELDLVNEQITLTVTLLLKEQNENTEVQFNFKDKTGMTTVEAVRQPNYSYQAEITLPLSERLEITASRIDGQTIKTVYQEEYALRSMYLKDFEIRLVDQNAVLSFLNTNSKRTIECAIALMDESGAYLQDSYGDMVTKIEMAVIFTKEDQQLGYYQDTYLWNQELEESSDAAIEISHSAILYAYPEVTGSLEESEKIVVEVILTINGHDQVKKSMTLKALLENNQF